VDDEKHLVPVITLPLVDNENPFRTLPPGEFWWSQNADYC
jgi:hypothetical protein